MVYNDFSERTIQAREMSVGLGPAKGKDFRGGHVLGPTLVTADEVPDVYDLRMVARVNGDVWCETHSRHDPLDLRTDDRARVAATSTCVRARCSAPARSAAGPAPSAARCCVAATSSSSRWSGSARFATASCDGPRIARVPVDDTP